MNRKIQIVTGLLIIVALLALQAPKITATPSQEDAQVYTIGEVLPYTGDLGEYGKGFKEGIDLAVEQTPTQNRGRDGYQEDQTLADHKRAIAPTNRRWHTLTSGSRSHVSCGR